MNTNEPEPRKSRLLTRETKRLAHQKRRKSTARVRLLDGRSNFVPQRRIALPAAAIALMTAAYTITKTGRDSLYMQEGGVQGLPLAYIGTAMIAPMVALSALAAMARFGPRIVRVIGPLAMAAFQLWAVGIARPGAGPSMTLLFMFIPAVYGVLISSTWLLAAESAPLARGGQSRLYALLASASVGGSISGALASKALAAHMDPQWFYSVGAVALLACAIAVEAAHRALPPAAVRSSDSNGFMPPLQVIRSAFSERYARMLAAVIVTSSLVGVLVEFLFYSSISNSLSGVRATSAYLATFYIWLNLAGLVLPMVLQPLMDRRVGLGGSLLFAPAAVVGGAVLLLVQVLTPGALRLTEGGMRSSTYRSSWEQASALVSARSRDAVKLLVDGIGSRAGEAMAAMLLLGVLHYPDIVRTGSDSYLNVVRVVLAFAALTWLLSVLRLRRFMGKNQCAFSESHQPGMHPPDGCPLTAALGERLVHREAVPAHRT